LEFDAGDDETLVVGVDVTFLYPSTAAVVGSFELRHSRQTVIQIFSPSYSMLMPLLLRLMHDAPAVVSYLRPRSFAQ
jgi:hypothetical protein